MYTVYCVLCVLCVHSTQCFVSCVYCVHSTGCTVYCVYSVYSLYCVHSTVCTVYCVSQNRGRWEEWIYDSLQIDRIMIVETVFLLIMNQTEFRLAYNQKENCHCDHNPFHLQGIINPFLSVCTIFYTQRNLLEILLNQTEIRLYLPFSDWFGSKRKSVWIQIYWEMVNTIWTSLI